MISRQIFEIFSNGNKFTIGGDFSFIEDGGRPSTQFTYLKSFSCLKTFEKTTNTKIVPWSKNGYQELKCRPESMIENLMMVNLNHCY